MSGLNWMISGFDQQLRRARVDHRTSVSWPLAGQTVLQIDQATPAHQSLLCHQSQRRAHAGHRIAQLRLEAPHSNKKGVLADAFCVLNF